MKGMMLLMDRVIEVATLNIGYLEKASNSQLDDKTANAGSKNYTKFARDYNEYYGGSYNYQGQAWCDMFVDDCFVKAYGVETAKKLLGGFNAYTPTSAQYFKNMGRYFHEPKKGDVIFFRNSERICHTGIVTNVSNGHVYTIEGNTSGASGVIANGGGVCAKSYSLSNSRIDGYGRPDYSIVGDNSNNNNKEEWKATGTATCTGNNVNIRKTPNGTILRSVNKNTAFEVDGKKEGKWVHIKFENIIGYMYEDYVKYNDINNNPSTEKRLTMEEVALQIVAGKGNWGDGEERKQKVNAYGYPYEEVRKIVNEKSGKKTSTNNSSSNSKPSTNNSEPAMKYTTGTYKVTASALTVRTGPGTNYPQVPYSKLTANAKKHAKSNGCLTKGTYMTASKVVKKLEDEYWIKIPSGYVCVELSGEKYCSKTS